MTIAYINAPRLKKNKRLERLKFPFTASPRQSCVSNKNAGLTACLAHFNSQIHIATMHKPE